MMLLGATLDYWIGHSVSFAPSTLAGWFTAIGSMGSLATLMTLLLRWDLGRGKLSIERQKQHDTDEADIRDHYADEVRQLRDRLDAQSGRFKKDLQELEDRYKRLLHDSERRHDQCQEDRDQLKERVENMSDEIRGLVRLIAQNSANAVIRMGDDVPDDIKNAAERVELILKDKGKR
jgi:hypothetical protein